MIKGHITIYLDDKGKLKFDVSMSDAYILKSIASLEEYLASKLDLTVDDLREIIDDEKKGLTARPLR